jgi:hypothetical protein
MSTFTTLFQKKLLKTLATIVSQNSLFCYLNSLQIMYKAIDILLGTFSVEILDSVTSNFFEFH